MQNEEIANQLGTYAKLLALHGGNSFQVNSYQSAAFNINKKITQNLFGLKKESLEAIPQLGKSAIGKILEIQEVLDAVFKIFDKLSLPHYPVLYGGSVSEKNVAELCRVRGLGGFLIGGASLKSDSFYAIYEHCSSL